jgi:peptidyl-prolyl cis-trans isomerase C
LLTPLLLFLRRMKMPVRVNGKLITDQEIAAEEERINQHLSLQVPLEQLEQMKDFVKQQAINSLVNRTLLWEAMESEGIEASDEEIDERMEMLKSKFESPEAYSQQLASLGITNKDLRLEMGKSLRLEILLQKHVGEIPEPTEAELASFYNENRERFKQPELVRASHILIKAEPGESAPERAAKRLEAAKLLGEIHNGADFAGIASRHSACPSKERGGDVGYFPRGRMVEAFEKAAFAMKPGEVSDVFESPFGYHIVKVTEKQPEQTAPFEAAKDDICTFLMDQRREKAVKVYTDRLREKADIEVTG